MPLDMRREFADSINEFGHWVILRKAILSKKCGCIDPATEEPDSSCDRCNGTGHSYVDFLLKARRSKAQDDPEHTTPVGKADVPRWHFYLMYHAEPTSADWILEIELEARTLEPVLPHRIQKFYDIQSVESMRGNGGQIVYHDCQVEESVWNVLS